MLGRIKEIRPAIGINWKGTGGGLRSKGQDDPDPVHFTFRIIGEKGEAAATVMGPDSFEGNLIYKGELKPFY